MGEVRLVNVSKRFTLRVDGKLHVVHALDQVSFSAQDGEIVALIGPSGCGKTTALRIAMGLETASGGKVTVDGVRGRRLRTMIAAWCFSLPSCCRGSPPCRT